MDEKTEVRILYYDVEDRRNVEPLVAELIDDGFVMQSVLSLGHGMVQIVLIKPAHKDLPVVPPATSIKRPL